MNSKCPCCGFYTFSEPIRESVGDICPVCFWEIDPIAGEDGPSGANHGLTLDEARRNFMKFGACEERMRGYVREPLPEELSDSGALK